MKKKIDLISKNHVIQNIYWCYPLTWACAGIIGFLYYEFVVRKEINQLKQFSSEKE